MCFINSWENNFFARIKYFLWDVNSPRFRYIILVKPQLERFTTGQNYQRSTHNKRWTTNKWAKLSMLDFFVTNFFPLIYYWVSKLFCSINRRWSCGFFFGTQYFQTLCMSRNKFSRQYFWCSNNIIYKSEYIWLKCVRVFPKLPETFEWPCTMYIFYIFQHVFFSFILNLIHFICEKSQLMYRYA